HRLHVRAVIADEHQKRAVLALQPVEAVGLAVNAGEREGRRLPAKIAYRGVLSQRSFLFANLSWHRSNLCLSSVHGYLCIWRNKTSSATGPRQPRPMTIFRAARILGKPLATS